MLLVPRRALRFIDEPVSSPALQHTRDASTHREFRLNASLRLIDADLTVEDSGFGLVPSGDQMRRALGLLNPCGARGSLVKHGLRYKNTWT